MLQSLRNLLNNTGPFSRARLVGMLSWAAVVGCLYAFLRTMARFEPITGDGWYNASDLKTLGSDLPSMIERLEHLHNHGNPRIGQLFTMLTYLPGGFHVAVTPLVLCTLCLLVLVHAMGRRPRFTSAHDAFLLLWGCGACWLAAPAPGQAFFYRPITTNYVYTLTLALLLLVPFRLAARRPFGSLAVVSALLIFPFAMFVGKTNEHTGPTLIVVALLYTLVALRRRDYRNACWMLSGTIGLLWGYWLLFFAPGQTVRYGKLGRQSVVETIVGRGLLGNAELLNELCGYVAPLLVATLCGVVAYGFARRKQAPDPQPRLRIEALGAYVLAAAAVAGTSLAAPKNHYRLFIAPGVLLAIASVIAVDWISSERGVRRLLVTLALALNLAFAWVFLALYGRIHEDELERLAIVHAAKPRQLVVVPMMRDYKRDALFYGDSLGVDARHRARMQLLYGLHRVKVVRREAWEKARAKRKKH